MQAVDDLHARMIEAEEDRILDLVKHQHESWRTSPSRQRPIGGSGTQGQLSELQSKMRSTFPLQSAQQSPGGTSPPPGPGGRAIVVWPLLHEERDGFTMLHGSH